MPEVTTLDALLETCLKDLHSAERETGKRSPAIVDAAQNDELRQCLERDADQSASQAERLERAAKAIGSDADGPECIWMKGVFDDADHDIETIAVGRLLDIALVGAIRKGKQAEVVSYETAIAAARALQKDEVVALLDESHREEQRTDGTLQALLTKLATSAARADQSSSSS